MNYIIHGLRDDLNKNIDKSDHKWCHEGCLVEVKMDITDLYKSVRFVKHHKNCDLKKVRTSGYNIDWLIPAGRLGKLLYT